MTRIKDLSRKSSMNDGDVFPCFDSANSATRSVSFKILRDAVPNISDVTFEDPNLIITFSDGTTSTTNISEAGTDPEFTTLTEGQVPRADENGQLVYGKITVDEENELILFDYTGQFPAGSLQLGQDGLVISSGAEVIGFVSSDGAKHYIHGIEYDDSGSSQPRYWTLAAEQITAVADVQDSTLSAPQVLSFTTIDDSMDVGFRFIPATAGTLTLDIYIGTDTSGAQIVGAEYTVESSDVGNVTEFDLPNDYLLEAGKDLYIVADGVDFLGGLQTSGIFVGQTVPYVDLIEHPAAETFFANRDDTIKYSDITIDGEDRTITAENSSFFELDHYDTTSADYLERGTFNMSNNGVSIEYATGNGSGGDTAAASFILFNTGAFFADGITQSGIKYLTSSDYANATDKTLMPKEYIDENAGADVALESTRIVSGSTFSINGSDDTTWDLDAGEAELWDFSTIDSPVLTSISWTAQTGLSVTALASAEKTAIAITNDNTPRTNIVFTNSFTGTVDGSSATLYIAEKIADDAVFDPEERRLYAYLGRITHFTNTEIFNTNNLQGIGYSPYSFATELYRFLGPTNFSGNEYQSNAGTATVTKTSGSVFAENANVTTNGNNPHFPTSAQVTTVSFLGRYYNLTDFTRTFIGTSFPFDQYNDTSTGMLAKVPNNRWVSHRIYLFADSNNSVIQYGQTLYSSLESAVLDLEDISFIADSDLVTNAVFRGWFVCKGNETTTDGGDWYWYAPSNTSAGSSATSTFATLQAAYDASIDSSQDPEIIIQDVANGALTIQDSSTNANNDTIFHVIDASGNDLFHVERDVIEFSETVPVNNVYNFVNGLEQTSKDLSVSVATAQPANRLQVSGINDQFNGVYTKSTYNGTVRDNFLNTDSNSNYWVFKKVADGGFDVVVFDSDVVNFWWCAFTTTDPDTWTNGGSTGIQSSPTEQTLAVSSQTLDGKNAPNDGDSNVDYLDAIVGGFIEFDPADGSTYVSVLDEDDMSSDSATHVPTQQSVKAYVDVHPGTETIYAGSGALSGNTVVTGYSSDDLTFAHYNDSDGTGYTLRSEVVLEDNDLKFALFLGDGFGADLSSKDITMTNSGIVVTDAINTKGIENAADYSSSWTDHSLVTKVWTESNFLNYTKSGSDQTVTTGNGNDAFTILSTGTGAVNSPTFRFDNGWRVGNDEILSIGRDTPLRFDDGNVFSETMVIQHDSSSGGFNSIDFKGVRTVTDGVKNFEWNFFDDTSTSQWRVFNSEGDEVFNLQRDGSLTVGNETNETGDLVAYGSLYARRRSVQYTNGSDTTTNLNTGSFTAIPIFNADESSNFDSNDFTVNSTTEVTANFDGYVKLSTNLTLVQGTTTDRFGFIARFYVNGIGVGPENRCYIRNQNSLNHGSISINEFEWPVSVNDIITLRGIRDGINTVSLVFNANSQSIVRIERV